MRRVRERFVSYLREASAIQMKKHPSLTNAHGSGELETSLSAIPLPADSQPSIIDEEMATARHLVAKCGSRSVVRDLRGWHAEALKP